MPHSSCTASREGASAPSPSFKPRKQNMAVLDTLAFWGDSEDNVTKYDKATHTFWKQWLHNANVNRAIKYKCLPELFNTLTQEPCLCVGAGPSLQKNIKDIKIAYERGFKIISCDRAYKYLKENGITPYITFTLDSQDIVIKFFEDVEIGSDEKFAASITTDNSVAKLLEKSDLYFYLTYNSINPVKDMLLRGKYGDEFMCLVSGSTVMTGMVDFAVWAGCNPIVTIGNDLCMGHNESAQYFRNKQMMFFDKIVEKYSMLSLMNTKSVLTQMKKSYSDTDMIQDELEFIDCSGGLMYTWKQISLRNAIWKYGKKQEGVDDQ